jgi:hypothetical protein
MKFLVGFAAFFIVSTGTTAAMKSAFGPWADLTPNVLWWTPFSVWLPGYFAWSLWKHRSSLKLYEWVMAFNLAVVLAAIGGLIFYETFSYAVDMTQPLDEHRINVTRVYKWHGIKSPDECRVVDDRGREFRFPAFVNPKLEPGPTVIRVTRFRQIVLYAEPAPP